ncbi:hypothetical protein [Metabacillus idriensis]|uniref:hypothetical protein n=1 Tax=Metabacillus idriensis TaxID=324768 RepID=UPI003D2D56FA
MNKKGLFYTAACLLLIILLSAPFWLWRMEQSEELNVLIIDKTVVDDSYREHKGIVWLLNTMKKTQDNGKVYDAAKDYSGYLPKEKKGREIPDSLSSYQLIYLADTYGVFTGDSDQSEKGENRLIYGGMKLEETEKLLDSVKKNSQSIVAEFNTFASPTKNEAREKLEELFHLHWTGWTGRYYLDLNSEEVPDWLKKNYETSTKQDYSFSGPGLVFVHESEEVMIFTKKDFEDHPVTFSFTEKGKKLFQLNESVRYNYWFDVIEPRNEEEVLADYNLSLNQSA